MWSYMYPSNRQAICVGVHQHDKASGVDRLKRCRRKRYPGASPVPDPANWLSPTLEGQDASQINKVLLDIEKLLKLVPIDPKSKGYSSFFVESLAHSISKLKLLEKNESSKNSHARRTHCRRAWPVQYRDVVSARSLLNY